MKQKTFFIAAVGMMMLVLGACGSKEPKEVQTAEDPIAEAAAPKKADVKISYNSPVAAGRRAFAEDPTHYGPLVMADGRLSFKSWSDTVSMGDFGAFDMYGRRKLDVVIMNYGDEALIVDSILLPDNRFEAEWNMSSEKFPPMALTVISLYNDSFEPITDYRIVVVFRNENIPPQTLHFNIHPDIEKLQADYASSRENSN
ncbi:MAG: hypothetical protein K2J18_07280 [Paramuribaculum sp.]|nr:hypothetical protein [Paramuribaculum sp.]